MQPGPQMLVGCNSILPTRAVDGFFSFAIYCRNTGRLHPLTPSLDYAGGGRDRSGYCSPALASIARN
jgi:hypothetical protein